MIRRIGLISVLAGVAGLTLAPGSALAGTLDQQQTDTSGNVFAISSTQSVAQTFNAGLTGQVDRVDLCLRIFNSPTAPLSVEIRNVVGGVPGGTVLASSSIPASIFPGTLSFFQIDFAAPPAVAPGTQYAIVAYSSTYSGSGMYGWAEGITVDPYVGGTAFFVATSPPSGAWSPDTGKDLAFKTYVAPVLPLTSSPTGERSAALKKCKKKHSKKARKKCRKKANLLPV